MRSAISTPHVDEVNALTLDDPELFKYPVAYVIEVDWWAMTDSEAAALRDLPAEGRLPDRGRLQAATVSRRRSAAASAAAGRCSRRR